MKINTSDISFIPVDTVEIPKSDWLDLKEQANSQTELIVASAGFIIGKYTDVKVKIEVAKGGIVDFLSGLMPLTDAYKLVSRITNWITS